MFLKNDLKNIFSKLLDRKYRQLEVDYFNNIPLHLYNTSVFLYMLLNLDKYFFGILVSQNLSFSEKKDMKSELLLDFLAVYSNCENKQIRDICLFYQSPVNLKEVFWYEYKYQKLEYKELVKKLETDNFLSDISIFVSEFYSEEDTQISKCVSYSQKLPVPTNLNYENWSFIKAQDFVNRALNVYERDYPKYNSSAHTFYNFVSYNLPNVYENYDVNKYDVGSQYYYDERRRFLSMFFDNSDRDIQIIAYSFAIPIKAFRSFLWNMNVDLQDLESYIRRMDDKQLLELKNAYYFIFHDTFPFLPQICAKGWKHIFHKPSLAEIKNEELYDESERFNQNWAVVKNESCLDMGFTKYRGTEDDTVNHNAKYLSKKDHKNYKDQGFSEFYINPDGFYGIATRKIFGNYLWGDFDEQEVSGWVCPRFWTTFLLYFTLLVVSPACCGLLLFGGIENTKVIVWLSIFASLLPLIISAYMIKFLLLKVVDLFLHFISGTDDKLSDFIDYSIKVFDVLDNSKTLSKILYMFLKIVWYCILIAIFSYAYEPILAVSFTVIVDYFVSSYLKKRSYVPLSRLKYAKYAIFLLLSSHLIFVWETLFDISKFFYEFILNNYAYIISISIFILAISFLINVSSKYFEVQNKYVLGKLNYDFNFVHSLFDKLVMIIIFSFLAILIGQIIFFLQFFDFVTFIDVLLIISKLIGINILIFSISFFLFKSPTVLEYEKSQYLRGKKLVDEFVDNKMAIFAVSNNKWILDKIDNFMEFNNLFDFFVTDSNKNSKILFAKYISRLDDEFLFEVRSLKTILNSRNIYYSYKHIKKLVNSQMTAREVVDYYDKLEAIENKIFEKSEIIHDFFANVFKILGYPFIWIWSIVCKIFGAIVDLYEFVVDTFHKMCPYSNASERI
ncbi:MAG: hypothetical protein Q8K30_01610 [Candidatus Gracilibacteria bacterium]|nr:hypothetical protein [Candidatus Gracilibacteria bacterium]